MVDQHVVWHDAEVSRTERWDRLGLRGAVVWFTGLSGSGKSSVATALERILMEAGRPSARLDGDNLRHGLCSDLGFSAADRDENIRRVGEVAVLMADAGVVALVPVISPYRAGRERAREKATDAGVPFIEVFVDTPMDECERRDPKGLYAKARAGELEGFTGIDAPYEAPSTPELRVTPADGTPAAQAAKVAAYLARS
jgi:bifunctional enzyme CysN/CysC